MEAAIVGGILRATLPSLFKLVGDRCKPLEPVVRRIRSELELMEAIFLCSRWRGNETSELRRILMAQLRRLAEEIQDFVDSFDAKMISGTQFRKGISDLEKSIQDLFQMLQPYIGQELSKEKAQAPMVNDAEEDLLTLLQTQSEKPKVICAIGFGGQNTDLARRVYEKKEVCRQFGQRAWVSALDKTVDDVLMEILGQLERRPGLGMLILSWFLSTFHFFHLLLLHIFGTKMPGSSPPAAGCPGLGMLILSWFLSTFHFFHRLLLHIFGTKMPGSSPPAAGFNIEHQLKLRLSEKRCLIVINDVGTEEVYNGISAISWAHRVGSRVIMTTNIPPTVRSCICGDNDEPVPVPDNSTADGLVLVGEVGTETLYEKTCFELCDTAVARMQGSLRSDYERVVLENMLLYFTMFPRDHGVRRNPLIRRWLAEGLLVDAIQKVPENVYLFDQQIAAKHLDIFIRRNFIKCIKKSNNGKVKRLQPPAMVFNHICRRAVIESFITLLCGTNQTARDQGHVCRVSLHPHVAAAEAEDGGLNMPTAPRLRTMVLFPTAGAKYGAILSFDKHKLLRVLDLKECADLVKKKHVIAICGLLLLKYLSLGSSVECVPRKIRRLQRLETLDMRTTDVVTVYSELLKLPKLKHLLGKFKLSRDDCPDKSMLNIFAKKTLRLDDEFLKLKDFLRKNSVLETLAGIVIGDGIGLPQLLSDMTNLRKVKIWCDSTTYESTDLTGLKEDIKVFTSHGIRLPNVDYSLSIDINGPSQSFLECLEDRGRLASLKLSGNLTLSRPVNKWLVSVQELCLSWTNLDGDLIQTGLSSLTCPLKFLKLVERNLRGLSIQNEGPFVGLERICLVGMESLKEIIIQDLTKLASLHLLCQTLGDLPGVQIGSLRNLKEVGLHSEVDNGIRHGWEAAAMDHQRQPNVVSVETP